MSTITSLDPEKYRCEHDGDRYVNPPITLIEDGLYLGDRRAATRFYIIQGENINTVVSINTNRYSIWEADKYREQVPKSQHIFVPTNDSMTHDMLPDLAWICDHIDSYRATGGVLVHCKFGISRSATAIIAYLMRSRGFTLDQALQHVKDRRIINPNQNFMEQLKVWEETAYNIWEDSEKTIPKPQYASFLEVRAERLKERGLTGNEPIGVQSWDDL